MKESRISAALAAACLAAALGGCGQKGALYLPDAAPKAIPAVPTSKPATPPADDPATRRKAPTLPDPESAQ